MRTFVTTKSRCPSCAFYLWGVFPPFEASVPREKTKLSGRRRAERRAAIPWAISDGLIRACEKLAAELLRGGPELPPSSPRAGAGQAPVDARPAPARAPRALRESHCPCFGPWGLCDRPLHHEGPHHNETHGNWTWTDDAHRSGDEAAT